MNQNGQSELMFSPAQVAISENDLNQENHHHPESIAKLSTSPQISSPPSDSVSNSNSTSNSSSNLTSEPILNEELIPEEESNSLSSVWKRIKEEGSLIASIEIPDKFGCYTLLQSMLEDISDRKIDQIIQFIQFMQPNDPSIFPQMIQIIISFYSIRPLQHQKIVKLLSLIILFSSFPLNCECIARKYPFLACHLAIAGIFSAADLSQMKSHEFQVLYSSGLPIPWNFQQCFADRYQEKDFGLEEIVEWGYERNSLGFFLKFNDFDNLQVQSTDPGFDYEQEIFISIYDNRRSWMLEKESLLSFSAFYGSVACFKFIFLNGSKVSRSVTKSSVKGGNHEILMICEQEHGDFTKCLPIAVQYLRNNIADWLLMNFKVSPFSFIDCILSVNFPCIFFLLSNGGDLNWRDSHGNTTLFISSVDGELELCKIFIELGADVKVGKNPVIGAAQGGYSEIIAFLLSKCKSLIDKKGKDVLF
jgi:hypothetical protein